LLLLATKQNDIILDFFAGSGTTAHAVMQLNAEDGGGRKFVMIQIPEEVDIDSEAYKAEYKYISDISKERIRRAGKKILEENADTIATREKPLDIGFRAYKADTTNMKDVYYHPSQVVQEDLFNLVSNIKEDRTPEDLLTQVILDLGLTLDLPVEKKELRGNSVYFVVGNALVSCFDDKIDFGIVDDIATYEPLKVVFKDASFKEEQDRTNVDTRMKRLSPETIITVL
jgi:adenine-specific DNA-methyltransferase